MLRAKSGRRSYISSHCRLQQTSRTLRPYLADASFSALLELGRLKLTFTISIELSLATLYA